MKWFEAIFSRKDKHPDLHFEESNSFDEADMLIEEPYDPDFTFSGMRVGLIYRDRQGLQTRRIVRLKRLDAGVYESYIHAYCELRKEDRIFVVQSISALYDPSTGEIIDDADNFFGPYIEEKLNQQNRDYEKQHFKSAWQVIEALRDELQILILVARADNRFVRAEQVAILRYANERAIDLNIQVNDKSLMVLRDWIKIQDPSEPEARIALSNLKHVPGALESIWEVSELIALADGKIRDEEQSSITEIRNFIQLQLS